MLENDVYAAVRIVSVSLIDTGRTVAVQLEKADGECAAILLSRAVCDELQRRLNAALDGNDLVDELAT